MQYNRELLFGSWYRGDTDDNGNVISESSVITADGSYEFTFIVYDAQGHVMEQSVELGDWGLVGDIHFTLAKSEFIDKAHYAADLNDADNYHAYNVLKLNSQIFKYQHVITNEVFILKRVVDKIGYC